MATRYKERNNLAESRLLHKIERTTFTEVIMKLDGWRIISLASGLFLCVTLVGPFAPSALANSVVELPILAAIRSNHGGVFELLLLQWDQAESPDPVTLQWQIGNVVLGSSNLNSMATAFRYAIDHTPSVRHTGHVTVFGIAYAPTGSDGPSAGAAMAVGFLSMFKGDPLTRGVALTGTIQPDGSIGPVGSIPDKVRAAAREGYRTVLIPSGQLHDSRWDLPHLGFELNVEIREVRTIDEAYHMMTGRSL